MTLQNMMNVLKSKPYTVARITRDTEWQYHKGKPVYLLRAPEGWKFEVKALDKDLALQPRWASGQAHIMWDNLGNAYQGCGFDKACAHIP